MGGQASRRGGRGAQVRFDLPSTMLAFVQSSGRARMADSHMVLMLETGNPDHATMLHDVRRCAPPPLSPSPLLDHP